MWTHVDRGRGGKNVIFFCGRHKWMAPNYRTIALISHTSKILLKILHKRMESTIERELPDNQAGFRKARGTRDHIANMRWIMERQLEYGKEVHICFIDYS